MINLIFLYFLVISAGYILVGVFIVFGISSLLFYWVAFIAIYFSFQPRLLFSPLSFIHAYYFVFFLVAPSFAEIHADDNFASPSHFLAYSMIFATHCTVAFGASAGQRAERGYLCVSDSSGRTFVARMPSSILIVSLLTLSSFLVLAIVLSSGGVQRWIDNPGDAFLNRAGSGVYVVLSHFSSFILAAIVGYRAYVSRRMRWLLIFLLWLVITSPVHGSKSLLITFFLLAIIPWVSYVRFLSVTSALVWLSLILIFLGGLYFRNFTWITLSDVIPYSLNYFSAFRNLLMLLNDFDAGFLETFFLPFNKFLTPIGLSDPKLYFDMNHVLTDKYFPSAWAIRATEQWPVEADLYLNFYFVFGLPLIFLYGYLVGKVFGKALKSGNLGMWVAAVLVVLAIPSHLRGSLYNHVHFYLYPMIYIIFLLLQRYQLIRQRAFDVELR